MSEANRKSDHKHLYEFALVKTEDIYRRIKYCTICGKINNIFFFETIKVEGMHFNKIMTSKEILSKYNDLKIFETDMYSKSVDLGEQDEKTY